MGKKEAGEVPGKLDSGPEPWKEKIWGREKIM